MATNAALVAAKAARCKPPPNLPPPLASLCAEPRVARGERRRARVRQSAAGAGDVARSCCRHPARRRGVRRQRHRRTASRSMWNMSPPTRPGRCISAIAAARWWAMRSPTCWPRPATTSPRNTTSTMPGRRSLHSPGRLTGATCKRIGTPLERGGFFRRGARRPAISRRVLDPRRRSLARQYGASLALPDGESRRRSLARDGARLRRRGDAGGNPRRSGGCSACTRTCSAPSAR